MKKQLNDGSTAQEDHHYDGTMHAIAKIMEDEGLGGLYSGMGSSLLGVASTNFAYFYWYSVVRTLYITSKKLEGNPTTVTELSLGAVAGALAQMFTIPIAVVTTRQQTQRKSERKGLIGTAQEVINSEDGYSGLWRGLKASLVLVVNPSITYGAYQRFKQILFPNVVNLKPWQAFRKFSQTPFENHELINISARSHVKVARNNSDTASDCSEGPITIKTSTREEWEEV